MKSDASERASRQHGKNARLEAKIATIAASETANVGKLMLLRTGTYPSRIKQGNGSGRRHSDRRIAALVLASGVKRKVSITHTTVAATPTNQMSDLPEPAHPDDC